LGLKGNPVINPEQFPLLYVSLIVANKRVTIISENFSNDGKAGNKDTSQETCQ
jgi:hypothetical protein